MTKQGWADFGIVLVHAAREIMDIAFSQSDSFFLFLGVILLNIASFALIFDTAIYSRGPLIMPQTKPK